MKKRAFLWALFSFLFGLLSSLPLIFSDIPLLSFLLFIPYSLFLCTRGEETRLTFYYFSGLLFFLGYYGGAFSFFAAMYPLDFAGLNTAASLAVLFAAMVLLPLFQAVFSAFSVLLLGLLQKKRVFCFPLAFSLAWASLFTLFAFLQNFTWAGVPWANTAIGIAGASALIQSASLFGSSFLSFLILFVNAALAESFLLFRACRDRAALLSILCAVALFFSNALFGMIRLSVHTDTEKTLTVAVIQPNAPSKESTFLSTRLEQAMEEAFLATETADVDLMLWSESIVNYSLEKDELLIGFFSDLARSTGAYQVVGAFSSEETETGEDDYYNALFLFAPDGSLSEEVYHKRRPVPFGEYVPMKGLFETLIPALTEISMLSRDTNAGNSPALFHTDICVFGGLICFDSIYPALARESVTAGAEALLLSTDDSWFDGSFAKSLHLRHASLRAVECRRAVVRTGNTGISAVIDQTGVVLTEAPPDETAHAVAEIALSSSHTLYTRMGDVFPVLCLAYLLLLPARVSIHKKRKEVTK